MRAIFSLTMRKRNDFCPLTFSEINVDFCKLLLSNITFLLKRLPKGSLLFFVFTIATIGEDAFDLSDGSKGYECA